MDNVSRSFIEKLGLHFEADGMPRTAGRVLGFLMLQDDPASLEAISDALQVSKASSSTNCRLLERAGFADRVSLPGDRKDYYRISPEMAQTTLDAARHRIESMERLMSWALESLPASLETGHDRIREMLDLHGFLADELDTVIDRWRVRRKAASERIPADNDSAAPAG
ncbi:MAG: MarR family transcriptional regulator [Gemmatimonadales bacterium]|nr:MAG: MarR family transcriptional regulator [Gemmatimonadales bacterium]